jgi:hypothetical protein
MHMTSHVVLSDGKLGECLSMEPQSKLAKKGAKKTTLSYKGIQTRLKGDAINETISMIVVSKGAGWKSTPHSFDQVIQQDEPISALCNQQHQVIRSYTDELPSSTQKLLTQNLRHAVHLFKMKTTTIVINQQTVSR